MVLGNANNALCRNCGNYEETVNHIFFNCPNINTDELRIKAHNLKLNYNINNILNNNKLKLTVEKLIKRCFLNT